MWRQGLTSNKEWCTERPLTRTKKAESVIGRRSASKWEIDYWSHWYQRLTKIKISRPKSMVLIEQVVSLLLEDSKKSFSTGDSGPIYYSSFFAPPFTIPLVKHLFRFWCVWFPWSHEIIILTIIQVAVYSELWAMSLLFLNDPHYLQRISNDWQFQEYIVKCLNLCTYNTQISI